MKEIRGTRQVYGAHRFPDYTYKQAVHAPIDLWSVDPARLNPCEQFPRSDNPIRIRPLPYVDLIDYCLKISEDDVAMRLGTGVAQVWLQPNKYTAAREEKKVWECTVGSSLYLFPADIYDKWIDWLVSRAFLDRRRGAQRP
jgi:hypothetical protein